MSSTAIEIRFRQHEVFLRVAPYYVATMRAVAELQTKMFSNRGQAVLFGIKRQPVTDDMRQMLDDLEPSP